MQITAVVDADHAHDRQTRRSISGIIIFVGRTPVVWISKRQGSVQASTYGAEFNAMRTAIEEILSIRYSLRSFGVPVTSASRVFGDNMSVLLNIQQPDSQLRKKHLAISYHVARESCAARIVEPFYIPSSQNYADPLTKQLAAPAFQYHFKGLLYDIGTDGAVDIDPDV